MVWAYLIYGLHLQSNCPIPGLLETEASPSPDVQVCLGSMPKFLLEALKEPQRVWYSSHYKDERGEHGLLIHEVRGEDYLHLAYVDGTQFILDRRGLRIWGTWPEALTLEDTATYLLGPVLGLALGLRGVTCLHASAIAVDGAAIALAGPAGAGKSTTAAAFARLGYPILSDDVVALGSSPEGFLVQAAYPRIRLWPQSTEALFGSVDALPTLTPTWNKRYLALSNGRHRFQGQPLPLAAIYLIGERSEAIEAPLTKALSLRSSLISLVTNSYAAHLLDREMQGKEFETLGHVVHVVPVRLVIPHNNITNLTKLCRTILDDFHALTT